MSCVCVWGDVCLCVYEVCLCACTCACAGACVPIYMLVGVQVNGHTEFRALYTQDQCVSRPKPLNRAQLLYTMYR